MEKTGVARSSESILPPHVYRLVRSSYLLDYILNEMSVIEPENGAPLSSETSVLSAEIVALEKHIPSEPIKQSNEYYKDLNEESKPISPDVEEKVSSKKRKANKLKKASSAKKLNTAPTGGSIS